MGFRDCEASGLRDASHSHDLDVPFSIVNQFCTATYIDNFNS